MNDLLWLGLMVSLLVILGGESRVRAKNFDLYDQGSPYRSYPFQGFNHGVINPQGISFGQRPRPVPRPPLRPRRPHSPKYHDRRRISRRRNVDCKCGLKPPSERTHGKFRVVGGHAGKFKRPWYTYLLIQSAKPEQKVKKFECGGTLINYRYILTAAHCICKLSKEEREEDKFCLSNNSIIRVNSKTIKTMQALIGENHKTLIKKYPRDIDLYVIHEEWLLRFDQHYDVALVRLKERIKKFSYRIQPICLPSSPSITRAFKGKNYRIDFSKQSIVAGFGHVGYISSKKVQCQTDHRLPRPFHTCKGKCFKTDTPSSSESVCKELSKHVGLHRYEDSFDGEHGAVNVWNPETGNSSACFSFQAGRKGWCKVYPNFRSDKIFSDFSNSSWGFCGDNFCQSDVKQKHTTSKLQEIELDLIQPDVCEEILKAVSTKSKAKKVFNKNEFCAGRKHKIRVFNYDKGPSDLHLSPRGASQISFVGGGDTCAGDSGSGMWQWVDDYGSRKTFGVVIGVVSRGYGCAFVNRPGIYISVPSLLHWIHAYAKEGGCLAY